MTNKLCIKTDIDTDIAINKCTDDRTRDATYDLIREILNNNSYRTTNANIKICIRQELKNVR